jgi:hypothetical protein
MNGYTASPLPVTRPLRARTEKSQRDAVSACGERLQVCGEIAAPVSADWLR